MDRARRPGGAVIIFFPHHRPLAKRSPSARAFESTAGGASAYTSGARGGRRSSPSTESLFFRDETRLRRKEKRSIRVDSYYMHERETLTTRRRWARGARHARKRSCQRRPTSARRRGFFFFLVPPTFRIKRRRASLEGDTTTSLLSCSRRRRCRTRCPG
jgi:hypothetical protein